MVDKGKEGKGEEIEQRKKNLEIVMVGKWENWRVKGGTNNDEED